MAHPSARRFHFRPRWSVDDVTVTEPSTVRRAIAAAGVGNLTEWYDFGVYAFFEPTITKVFFSNLSHTQGTLATFALFAVAFLVRPFGGMFFGPLADRIGRNKVLATTMLLMAGGTFAIGCIPSPDNIGIWGPILLLLCRLVQGFSTGGEYGNAMTFIAEYAPDRRRGFLGSLLEFGTFAGYLLGAIAVTCADAFLTDAQLHSWGWRLPFFLALPLGAIGLYLRARLGDTPAFEQLEAESEAREKENRAGSSLRDALRLWPSLLVCMGLVVMWNVTNYMLTSYMPTYVSDTLPKMSGAGITPSQSQMIQIVVMAFALVTIPFMGRLSDRVGRKPLLYAGGIGLVLLGLPMIWMIRSHNLGAVFAGLMLMALMLTMFSGAAPSTLPALFPTKVRGAGLSVAFNIAISLFCGTVSLVVGSLVAGTGDLNWPGYYLIIAGVVGVISVYFVKEPNGRRMWGSPPAAESTAEAVELVHENNAAVVAAAHEAAAEAAEEAKAAVAEVHEAVAAKEAHEDAIREAAQKAEEAKAVAAEAREAALLAEKEAAVKAREAEQVLAAESDDASGSGSGSGSDSGSVAGATLGEPDAASADLVGNRT